MSKIISIAGSILNVLYKAECLRDTKKKVLFLSRQNNKPSIDIELLSESIRKKHPDYEVVTLCKRMRDDVDNKYAYVFHILKQMWEMSSARVVILDSACIPASLLSHRSNQVIVQIWHSIGTMKKNSYSILDQPEGHSSDFARAMKMHRNYDCIFCAGEGYREYLAEGFNYAPEDLMIAPLPRIDLLRNKEWIRQKREEILAAYPELVDKKNILYAPTFRRDEDEKAEFEKAVGLLKKAFEPYKETYNLIIKAHPLSDVDSDCKEYSSMELLPIADAMISDYSCVVYEAGIMNIPLYFYTYDYKKYIERRSMYMDYPKEIPGEMHYDAKLLVEDIVAKEYDFERLKSFVEKYIELPQGSASDKMVDLIWEKLED